MGKVSVIPSVVVRIKISTITYLCKNSSTVVPKFLCIALALHLGGVFYGAFVVGSFLL